MKIDHVAAYVSDLEMMRLFYETYFNASANQMYHNQKTGLQTYFLAFPDGGRLEIMARPDQVEREKGRTDTGWIHLAFQVGGEDAVDALTERLSQDGYEVVSGPRRTGDGYYESCILDPDGNQIEIVG